MRLLEQHPWLAWAQPPMRNFEPRRPFMHEAAAWGQTALIDFALAQGHLLEQRDARKKTLMHALFEAPPFEGQFEYIEKMIGAGARCDVVNGLGEPLWAVSSAFMIPTHWIKQVLELGAPTDWFDQYGVPGLSLMIMRVGRHATIEGLTEVIKAGADLDIFRDHLMDAHSLLAWFPGDEDHGDS